MRATVVIRTLNEERGIGRALDAVQAQDEPVEVLVIDSGSTDRTVAIVESRPSVRVHQIDPGHFTFGRACNLGAELATTPIVAYISGHAWPVDRAWSTNLLRPFADPDVAGVYGRQDPMPGMDPVRERGQRAAFAVDGGGRTHAHFSSANSAVRRSAWELIKFDEELSGGEDYEWARRQVEAGMRIVYAYDAAVYHSHRDSLLQVYRRQRRDYAGVASSPEEASLAHYARTWYRWSRAEAGNLLRRREVRWAAWAPLFFAAQLGGEFLGRRDGSRDRRG